jgi:hypothetical protein
LRPYIQSPVPPKRRENRRLILENHIWAWQFMPVIPALERLSRRLESWRPNCTIQEDIVSNKKLEHTIFSP